MMENKTQTDLDISLLKLLRDCYYQKYRIRTKIFQWILKHMQIKLKEEATIFLLMEEMQKNKKQGIK